jgi:hypothetical protein
MTPIGRQTSARTTSAIAECTRCDFHVDSNAGALGNAARHHDATGHPVSVTITRVIEYGDAHAPPPGQGDLFAPHTESTA